MAPKTCGDDADEKILKYLIIQNRPYSAVDIFNNLHGDVGKTQVVKSLDQLAVNEQIIEKTYGKQKVYCAKQNVDVVSDEDMRLLEERANELTGAVKDLQDECRPLEQRNKQLLETLSSEEMTKRLAEVQKRNAKNQETLNTLKEGTNLVSKDEVQEIEKKYQASMKLWRHRKRMCTNIVDMIMENYPKKKKDLFEEVGIETDEDAGIDLKTFL